MHFLFSHIHITHSHSVLQSKHIIGKLNELKTKQNQTRKTLAQDGCFFAAKYNGSVYCMCICICIVGVRHLVYEYCNCGNKVAHVMYPRYTVQCALCRRGNSFYNEQ